MARENRLKRWAERGSGASFSAAGLREGGALPFEPRRRVRDARSTKKGGPKGPPSRRKLRMDQKLIATPRDSALFSAVPVSQAAPEKTGSATIVLGSVESGFVSQMDLL